MLRFLLDTNIFIYVIKKRPRQMLEILNRHARHMTISAITLSELLHGVEKSADPERNLAVVENFCSRLDVLPYGPRASLHYGQIRSEEVLRLVSNNLREFQRVEGLLLENWA